MSENLVELVKQASVRALVDALSQANKTSDVRRALVKETNSATLIDDLRGADKTSAVRFALIEGAGENELLDALEKSGKEKSARFVSMSRGWLDERDPVVALQVAYWRLRAWAGDDEDKLQFAAEVVDVMRRFIALRGSE
jgi:hypothetical protein